MKSTGIVRKIDGLGRIVLPIELRRVLDVNTGDPIEIFTDSDSIILKKYEVCCNFCGCGENLTKYNHKMICKKCLDEIKTLYGD